MRPTIRRTTSSSIRGDFLDSTTIQSDAGFELALELTVKATLYCLRVAEVPTTWRDRTAGESNFKLRKWLPHYLHWYLAALRWRILQEAIDQGLSMASAVAARSWIRRDTDDPALAMDGAAYRPDLDGLRAVAIGLVMLAHARLPWVNDGGDVGVTAFFVLSGYVITSLLRRNQAIAGRALPPRSTVAASRGSGLRSSA